MTPDLNAALCRAAGIPDRHLRWGVGDGESSCFTAETQDEAAEWASDHRAYCKERGYWVKEIRAYPDLTKPEHFLALWDKLEDEGFEVDFMRYVNSEGKLFYGVHMLGADGSSFTVGSMYATRQEALAEAARRALGVE